MLACLTVLFFVIAVKSLHARISPDAPIMFYIAFLVDHFHFIPYQDTFDMNMPGSYLLYVLLGRASDYQDHGIRIGELCLVVLSGGLTWLMLRRMGGLTAWAASILFPLMYLLKGSEVSLQREFLILLFLSMALALLFDRDRPASPARNALIGLLIGICATIKPQLLLVWPLFAYYQTWNRSGERSRPLAWQRSPWAYSLAGFSLPIIAMFAYLASVHALVAFWDIAHNYWPLYGALNGEHQALIGMARVKYVVINTLRMGKNWEWLFPALFGLWAALTHGSLTDEQKRQVKLLAALALFFCLYPALSGQFWAYHSLPLLYFAVVLSSLCLGPLRRREAPRWLPSAAALSLALILGAISYKALRVNYSAAPRNERPDQIASFLAAHLRPGDRVQPLDWTGGAVEAMLTTRARIATPFVYDFYFYHHVSSPYIQGLRRRLIRDLVAAPPRFVIEVVGEDKPWPVGKDTTRQFPALRQLLQAHYHPAETRDTYIIWERNGPHGRD